MAFCRPAALGQREREKLVRNYDDRRNATSHGDDNQWNPHSGIDAKFIRRAQWHAGPRGDLTGSISRSSILWERSERWNYQLNTFPPPLTVSPATIPNATLGQNYPVTFSASGGVPPYGYYQALAAVPGMSLDPQTGVFSGRAPASVSGTYTMRIEASDSHSASGSRTYTFVVSGNNSLILSPLSLPNGTNWPNLWPDRFCSGSIIEQSDAAGALGGL